MSRFIEDGSIFSGCTDDPANDELPERPRRHWLFYALLGAALAGGILAFAVPEAHGPERQLSETYP